MFIVRHTTRLFVAILTSVAIYLASAGTSQAAVPIPSGFTLDKSFTGVRVYKKLNPYNYYDYVTIVDLRKATMMSFTGWVYGNQPVNGTVERRTLRTHWNNAVAQNTYSRTARVAINGTFFDPRSDPTGIAFGLKAGWWRMSYGYEIGTVYKGYERTFAYDSNFGSSSIQSYSRSTFDSGIPDVVGGLDPAANKDKYNPRQRTFVGVRDDNGDGHSETVIFYSTKAAPQSWAVSVLAGFGAGSKMMLDGGSSTGLIVDGTSYITPPNTLPQVFIIYSGK